MDIALYLASSSLVNVVYRHSQFTLVSDILICELLYYVLAELEDAV